VSNIGVFGTWRAPADSSIYKQAHTVGALAAKHGFGTVTGGYTGVMEAASRGAREGNGKTVGYTWAGLDGELEPNRFLDETHHFESIAERVGGLLTAADICVFFPGRTGTISELALATEVRSKGELDYPLILIGAHWRSFFLWLEKANCELSLQADTEKKPAVYRILDHAEQLDEILMALS